MITAPSALLMDGMIAQTKEEGLHRKNAPKRTRQRRRMALPGMAETAVRQRLVLAGTRGISLPHEDGMATERQQLRATAAFVR